MIVKNATFQSSKPFKVSLYGNSSAKFDGLQFNHDLELFDYATVDLFGGSSLYYVRAYGSSNVNAIGSTVLYPYAYDNSSVKISTCVVNRLEASDEAKVDVSVSTIKYSVSAEDSSRVTIGYSSLSGDFSSKKTSDVQIVGSAILDFRADTSDHSNFSLLSSKILPSKYSSRFSSKGFSTLHIHNSSLHDSVFSPIENSMVKIENSDLTSTYAGSLGNSLLEVSNSSIDWLLDCKENSNFIGANSSFTVASGAGSSNLTFNKCNITLLKSFDDSKIVVSDSVVEKSLVELDALNMTLDNFGPGFFSDLKFIADGLNVTFLRTIVNGWGLRFYGFSNVTFQDSNLISLSVFDSSKIWSGNSTFASANVVGASEVQAWSYLTVNVLDLFNSPVGGANVTIYLSGISVESGLTGQNGVATFELLEKVINSSGGYSVGKYEVNVIFADSSLNSSVDLGGDHLIVFTLQSPWWYWHMIIGFIIVIVFSCLSVFLVFRRKKRAKALDR